MKTAWAHLPNARHIDRVIAHVKAKPEKWFLSWDTPQWVRIGKAGIEMLNLRLEAWSAVRDTLALSGIYPAQNACAALIAYDDSARYLDYTPEELRLWAVLSEDPGARLLLPAVNAMNLK